jgi:regulator of cell morphogenesis and NO signaling
MNDAAQTTLGDLVAANPGAARVLDRLGLDYCCHGDRTLREASEVAGLAPAAVHAAVVATAAGGSPGWTKLDPPALADHIVETHHRYLLDELPALDALADKVLAVHGEHHPELSAVRRLVAELRADLEPHMRKEERVLFPAIHAIADGMREFAFGPVDNPIRMMRLDHEQAGELLAELRTMTGGYAVPADACASYRSLYERLQALELDTHLHIHKENHALFPAVLALVER